MHWTLQDVTPCTAHLDHGLGAWGSGICSPTWARIIPAWMDLSGDQVSCLCVGSDPGGG